MLLRALESDNQYRPSWIEDLGLGGVVFNFSDCCVLVSEDAPEGGQQQRYVSPRSTSGTVDVDAIYLRTVVH